MKRLTSKEIEDIRWIVDYRVSADYMDEIYSDHPKEAKDYMLKEMKKGVLSWVTVETNVKMIQAAVKLTAELVQRKLEKVKA